MKYRLLLGYCVVGALPAHDHKQVYVQPFAPYYSQCGQDKYLNEQVFRNKQHGVFIDIGAHDGISFSNSYYFEKYLGWTGICIEPHPDRFHELKNNRTAICLPICIADFNGQAEFVKISGAPEMLSGLVDCYDPRHVARINRELQLNGGSAHIINVETCTLASVVEKYKFGSIDLLSVDTEGSEFLILKSIDLKAVDIAYIVVENNYGDNNVHNYLIANGYRHIKRFQGDDLYEKIRS